MVIILQVKSLTSNIQLILDSLQSSTVVEVQVYSALQLLLSKKGNALLILDISYTCQSICLSIGNPCTIFHSIRGSGIESKKLATNCQTYAVFQVGLTVIEISAG